MSDFIHEWWEGQATRHGLSHEASWADEWAIRLEVDVVASALRPGGALVDIGCANGYSTAEIAARSMPDELVGIDFSAEMIARARTRFATDERFSDVPHSFTVGDAREIPMGTGTADALIAVRTLINLPSWEDQMTAIKECLRVTRAGGTVVLSEAFWEPLCSLNAIRAVASLSPLAEHDFNRYIKMERLTQFLHDNGRSFRVIPFSSVYYVGTRFLRELATDAAEFEGYSNPINKDFFDLESRYSGGPFSVQSAVVIDV